MRIGAKNWYTLGIFPLLVQGHFLSSSIGFSALAGWVHIYLIVRVSLFSGFPLGLASGEAGKVNEQGGKWGQGFILLGVCWKCFLRLASISCLYNIFPLKDTLLSISSHSLDPAVTGLRSGIALLLLLALGSWSVSCSSASLLKFRCKQPSSNVPSACCWGSGSEGGNEQMYVFGGRCFGEEGEKIQTNNLVNTAYLLSFEKKPVQMPFISNE